MYFNDLIAIPILFIYSNVENNTQILPHPKGKLHQTISQLNLTPQFDIFCVKINLNRNWTLSVDLESLV